MSNLKTNLPNSAKLLTKISQSETISLYGEGKLNKNCLESNIKKLKLAFPEIENEWFAVLINRLNDNNFTDQRLNDAVNKVIDTFEKGKTPHIANIIQYDLSLKLLTYNEMIAMVNKDGLTTRDFVPIKMIKGEKPGWIKKSIYEKYKHLINNI